MIFKGLKGAIDSIYNVGASERSVRDSARQKRVAKNRRLLLEALEDRRVFAAFAAGNIAVVRVGTGAAALTNAATATFIDEYTTSGAFVQSIAMPTATSGSNRQLTSSGTATSEGMLTRSGDGNYLVLAGYGTDPGTLSVNGTTSAATNRVIGRIDSQGVVNTATALTDFSSANNPRSVATTDGSNFYVTGGAGGLRYAALGATASTQLNTGTNSQVNMRSVSIVDGRLYATTGSGSAFRLGVVGAGLPTTNGQATTSLPGLPTGATGTPAYSPHQFFLADLSSTVPGVDTLYLTDDTATTGGVTKYSLVGATWVSNGLIGGTAGVRGLTGSVVAGSVSLFGTTTNSIVSLADSAGYNAAAVGSFASIVTATTNTAFRGVALTPVLTVNTPPTFSAIADQVTNEEVPVTVSYTVTDAETPTQVFVVTASSSNTALVPNGSIVTTVTGNNASTVITPALNQTGTAIITLSTVDALSAVGTRTFTVTVNNVNDAPTVTTDGFANYRIGGPAVNLDPLAYVIDVDGALNGGLATFSLGATGTSADTLAIRNSGTGTGQIGVSGNVVSFQGIDIGSFSGGSAGTDLVVTLNTAATGAAVEAIARSVTYLSSDLRKLQANRVVSIVVADGNGGVGTASTVSVRLSSTNVTQFQQGVDFGNGVYSGTRDNQITETAANANNVLTTGANTEGLLVDARRTGVVEESQVLLQFADIFGNGPGQIPIGSTIVSAKLVVDTNNPGDGGRFHRMLRAWDTTTATWNLFSSTLPLNDPGIQADDVEARVEFVSMVGDVNGNSDISSDSSFVTSTTVSNTIGVLEDVRAWAAGETNFGWMIQGWTTRDNGWAFTSSEAANPADRPRLEIEWVPTSFSTSTFQQGLSGYTGTVDTVITEATPTVGGATAVSLGVDSRSATVADEVQTLLRFDNLIGTAPGQIPPGALIQSASLILTGTAPFTAGDGGRFYRMNQAWTGAETWDSLVSGLQVDGTEAAMSFNAQAGNAVTVPNVEGGRNAFDVSSDIQAWVNGAPNNGWAILPWSQGTDGWFFQSSEEVVAQDRPALRVTYTVPGVAITPTSGLTTTENGGSATFSVVLNTPPSADVVIGVSSSNSSEGTVSASSLTFTSANWDIPQVVTVTGANDFVADGTVAYQVITAAITSADVNYNGVNPVDISLNNIDNDLPGVTVVPTSGLTTSEAGGQATFTVVLNSLPTASVTIGVASNDLTEGSTSASSLVFTSDNWFIPQTVTVSGVDDFTVDGTIGYSVVTTATSSDVLYNGIAVADVSLTNSDNDVSGIVVSPTSGLVTTERGGTATFSLVLTSQPTADVTISTASMDLSEGVTSVPAVVFTSGNWNVPRIVTVTGVSDSLFDGDIAYTIDLLTAVSTDPIYGAIDPANVSVVNLDRNVNVVTSSGATQYGSGLSGIGVDGRIVFSGSLPFLTNGTLSVSVVTNGNTNDCLEIRNEGTGPAQVGTSGSSVTFGGVTIGTFVGGTGTTPLVVTFNSQANLAGVQAVARAVTYRDTTVNGVGTRVIRFALVDGDGIASPLQTKTVNIGLKRVLELQEGVDRGFGVYSGAKDLALSQATPNTVLTTGADTSGLLVDFPDSGVLNTSQALLRFESIFGNALGQVPAGATITSASLFVQINNQGDGATLHRMLTPWNDQADTWNTFGNASNPRNNSGGVQADNLEANAIFDSQWNTPDASGQSSTGFASVAVTPDLRAWSAGATNLGWLMNPWSGGTDGWAFSPSEAANAASRPLLRIEWVPAGTSSIVFQQGLNGYSGTVDTQLRQSPTNNLNTTSQATAQTLASDYEQDQASNRSQILLRFDDIAGNGPNQIPANAIIHDAILTLASVSGESVGHGGAFYPMLTDWTDGATWDSMVEGISANDVEASSVISVQAGSSTLTPFAQAGFNDFSVVNDVRSWVQGATNRGWAILPWTFGDNAWIISSSESPSLINRPELEVFFTLPNTAPTISNIGNQTTAFQTPTTAIPVTVFDAETPLSALTLSVTSSSNAALVPVGNVSFGGVDGNRTLVVTPANGQSGTSDIVIRVTDGAGLFSEVTFTLTVQPATVAAPQVSSVVFGDGNAPGTQRSMVRSITVDFNSVVDIANGAFTLDRRNIAAGTWESIPTTALTIGVAPSTINAGAQTRALLTFSGSEILGGSLADGNYRLTINSNAVTAGGVQLDGNGDGTGGDNYIRGAAQADAFFRLFGDSDGNRTTNLAELGRLRQSFNLNVGAPGTPASAASFDSDWNGVVTLADLGRLRQRFNQTLGFDPPV